MATAPRPGVSRRQEAEKAHITVLVDGETYTLHPGELSALDSAALRRETGMSVRLLLEAAGKDPDLDVVAAIVWLARRQRGDSVSFDEVAAAIGYDTKVEALDEPVEDPDSPSL